MKKIKHYLWGEIMKNFIICITKDKEYVLHKHNCSKMEDAVYVIDLGEFCCDSEAEIEARIRGYSNFRICSECI